MQKNYYSKDRITVEQKKYEKWKKLMDIGARTGCHQLPERSLFAGGYQFPLCARCTGVLLGYVLTPFIYVKYGFKCIPALLGCGAMLADWSVQRAKLKESTNARRFITGLAGGYGIMSLQLALLGRIKKAFAKTDL